jgi:hypothetical protein
LNCNGGAAALFEDVDHLADVHALGRLHDEKTTKANGKQGAEIPRSHIG